MAVVTRGGVKLFYEEAGTGEPPLVFVHGWCCDHSYFAPQFEHFARGHRVLALDLRGHGQSDQPDEDYTIEGFADDVAALCHEAGATKPVVVGHSMGGLVALDLAARHPDVPAAVVMVDPAPIIKSPELLAIAPSLLEGLRGSDRVAFQRAFVENMLFGPADDPAVRERVLAEMTAAPQQVALTAMQSIIEWDGQAGLRACAVPVLDILAGPLTDYEQLRELCPHIMTGQTVGAGHFHQLLVPDQINAMIERFLAVTGVAAQR